jgi:hypothetical protein
MEVEGLFRGEAYGSVSLARARCLRDLVHSPRWKRRLSATKKLFRWNHIRESEYLAETARLTAVRAELLAVTAPTVTPVEVERLLDAWRTSIPTIRRELLGRLFDGLEVLDGHVDHYIPRKDREAAVAKLIDLAWPVEPQVMGFGGPGGI